mmetsp:Transcript_13951/g.40044  ORF Transcript_13951/g.40044 Transcript_13951/m.40044 type:complete len:211 (+) Transcript_13951:719-1351(+)
MLPAPSRPSEQHSESASDESASDESASDESDARDEDAGDDDFRTASSSSPLPSPASSSAPTSSLKSSSLSSPSLGSSTASSHDLDDRPDPVPFSHSADVRKSYRSWSVGRVSGESICSQPSSYSYSVPNSSFSSSIMSIFRSQAGHNQPSSDSSSRIDASRGGKTHFMWYALSHIPSHMMMSLSSVESLERHLPQKMSLQSTSPSSSKHS